MTIYVDELPKSCSYCPCFDDSFGCYFGIYTELCKRSESCPLKLLKDHDRAVKQHAYKKGYNDMRLQYELGNYDKQVRKEVVQEIRQQLKEVEKFHPEDDFEIDYDYYYKEDVDEILEKVEKGE